MAIPPVLFFTFLIIQGILACLLFGLKGSILITNFGVSFDSYPQGWGQISLPYRGSKIAILEVFRLLTIQFPHLKILDGFIRGSVAGNAAEEDSDIDGIILINPQNSEDDKEFIEFSQREMFFEFDEYSTILVTYTKEHFDRLKSFCKHRHDITDSIAVGIEELDYWIQYESSTPDNQSKAMLDILISYHNVLFKQFQHLYNVGHAHTYLDGYYGTSLIMESY